MKYSIPDLKCQVLYRWEWNVSEPMVAREGKAKIKFSAIPKSLPAGNNIKSDLWKIEFRIFRQNKRRWGVLDLTSVAGKNRIFAFIGVPS